MATAVQLTACNSAENRC